MTSQTVKEAMLRDYGSRDKKFMDAVKFVRDKVIEIAQVPSSEWVCILQPGAGTMGIEAAIGTLTPPASPPVASSLPFSSWSGIPLVSCTTICHPTRITTMMTGALLSSSHRYHHCRAISPPPSATFVLINTGKYSERQAAIVRRQGLELVELRVGEGKEVDVSAFRRLLISLKEETTRDGGAAGATPRPVVAVGYVHHETSTGMIYPGEAIYRETKAIFPDATVIADCMSSFGGIPFQVSLSCDCFITSPNKCFHSLPGLAIIVARRALIEGAKNNALNDTLDLNLQLKSFDASGQFRVTPPTTVVMALQQALKEYEKDGGLQGRQEQYAKKFTIVQQAVQEMGFTLFLRGVQDASSVGHIVVCVNMPTDPRFNFKRFYTFLNDRGYVIYPGSASHAKTFRFGIIGHTSEEDVSRLMKCSKAALQDMGIEQLRTPATAKL